MEDIIKVFDIGEAVTENSINGSQRANIEKLFNEFSKETHLITNCILNVENGECETSPLYYYNECQDKQSFDYSRIANDLFLSECKSDHTRNKTIRDGLLFIRANVGSLTIMKLEKLTVIDKATYEIKSELGKEKDYFKVCIFKGDYNDIKVIDKNNSVAKYWYEKFLKLTKLRNDDDNTSDVISLLDEGILFRKEIVDSPNYKDIKRCTENYLFKQKVFDKSALLLEINRKYNLGLLTETDLFSKDSEKVDSEFGVSEKVLNKRYQRKIRVTDDITISTKNYKTALGSDVLDFDECNRKITIFVDDKYIKEIKEKLND